MSRSEAWPVASGLRHPSAASSRHHPESTRTPHTGRSLRPLSEGLLDEQLEGHDGGAERDGVTTEGRDGELELPTGTIQRVGPDRVAHPLCEPLHESKPHP